MAEEKPNNEFKLNNHEEFVILKKGNPNLFLRDVHQQIVRDLNANTYDSSISDEDFWQSKYKPFHGKDDKNDVYEDEVTWTTSKSKRKKFNKVQSVYYYLNSCNGKCTGEYKCFLHDKNWEQGYHLEHVFEHYIGRPVNPELLKNFELHKYNPQTKLLGEAIDFDIYSYFIKYNEIFNLTQTHGQAVADVIKQLVETHSLDEYTLILSSKFNCHKNYSYNPDYPDMRDIPTSKDIYLPLAIKELGLNKEEVVSYNNKGFSAIAFKTEEEALKFKAIYNNTEKLVQIKSIKELIAEAQINLQNIKQFYENLINNSKKCSLKL